MVIKERLKENIEIIDNDIVTVTISGNVIEATYRDIEDTPEGGFIERIDEEHYRIKSTGEIKEYQHAEDRSGNIKSLYRTFANIRRLINANTTEPKNCKWVTITYADRNIKGVEGNETLQKDFRLLIKKLNRRYDHFEYITVVEPQRDGTWHLHAIFIWDKQAPYIPIEEFNKLWGKGICWLTKVDDNDNIGAYLSAYLGNAELEEAIEEQLPFEANDVIECEVKGEQKKFVKGARLHYYPNGMKIYRHSKGVKVPEKSKMHAQNLKIITEGLEPIYDKSYSYEIIDADTSKCRQMMVRQMQFNKKRKKP